MRPILFAAFTLMALLAGCRKQGTAPAYDFSYSGSLYTYNLLSFNAAAPAGASCYWNFGDGTVSNGSVPAHKYYWSDTFTVTLVVNGDSGRAVSKKIFIGSTTQRIAGAYTTTTAGQYFQQNITPIIHPAIYFLPTYPEETFQLTVINDSQLSLTTSIYPGFGPWTCQLIDSLVTDSNIIFQQNIWTYVSYYFQTGHLYYDEVSNHGYLMYEIESYELK